MAAPGEILAIQLSTGKTFCDPGTGIYTQFMPGGGLTDSGIWVPFSVDDNGGLVVTNPSVSSAALSAIPASITSVPVVVANPNRQGLILYNNSNSICVIAYAAVASESLFTELLEPGSTYNMDAPIYKGIVSAIWESANGFLQVTEL